MDVTVSIDYNNQDWDLDRLLNTLVDYLATFAPLASTKSV